MSELLHTPYDGTRKAFSVALAPLDLADWLEPDARLARDLAERRDLIASRRDVVLRERPDTRAAQREVLDLVVAHVTERFPQIYRREGQRLRILPAEVSVDLDEAGEAPFAIAGRLVQEDLLLMRKEAGAYHLVAGVLCFPSAWSLAEKFGQSLDGLHAVVPGYREKLATVMNRIFDNLKVEMPVWRLNWSIYPDDRRHHPESKEHPRDWFGDEGHLDTQAFIRVERQTLRRLPLSGDILFTVRIHVDPFAAFRRHPEGARLAAGLRDQILALDADQLAYKALAAHRDAVAGALDRIAAGRTG
ncbi:heme-dependent oxidative N-demethylase family protein [Ancylobacter terrae]|uniref:heme-dependent oxidative N-demethylase family protein n=1 Tax=Ancylobacter sp. sgz301288 TaxID=3342077 RepID=UPI00385CAE03